MFNAHVERLADLIKRGEYTSKNQSLDEQKAFEMFQFLLHQVREVGGTVYVIGNGGSAGIASHFAIDLLNTLAIPAQTLFDSNALTCFANDYGYPAVFAKPLRTLLQPTDLVVAISSSGSSENILRGAEVALEKSAALVTLSGFSAENPLRELGNLNFWLDCNEYGLVETGHFFLLHTLIDALNPCMKKSDHLKKLEV